MLAVLVSLALAQCGPGGPIFCGGASYATFEFAPISGAGMTAACACTSPTGAKAEAMSFTRASSATCLRGNTTTGIENGDLVTCSTDQAVVMPGGDGSGALGLLVESTRQNNALRSEAFDNAAWSKINSVAAAPVVTADAAVAPDGTTTADRVQFAATSGTQYSVLYNATNCPADGASASVFVKGNGMSGVIELGIDNGTAMQVAPCVFTANSWTRCKKEGVSRGVATGMAIGNGSVYTGVSRVANDVFLWGAQCENGNHVTGYIATAGVSATRAISVPTFTIAWPLPSFSNSEVVTTNRAFADNWVPYQMYFSGSGSFWQTFAASNAKQTLYFSATTNTVDSTGTMTLGLPNVVRSYATGSLIASCVNGSCNTSATADTVGGATGTLYLGRNTATTNVIDGVVKQFCLDPGSGRCSDPATVSATVSWIGDSLSAFGSPSAPSLFQAAFHKKVSSGATSGAPFDRDLEPGIGNAPGCVQQWASTVTKTNTVVLFCGINTILLDSSVSAATLWGWYEDFLEARIAEGRAVIPVTITPCGTHADCTAGNKTKISTFNTSLRTWCTANPSTTCVDLDAYMNDGAGRLWSAYRDPDEVHFTQAGYELLANLVGVAVGE